MLPAAQGAPVSRKGHLGGEEGFGARFIGVARVGVGARVRDPVGFIRPATPRAASSASVATETALPTANEWGLYR